MIMHQGNLQVQQGINLAFNIKISAIGQYFVVPVQATIANAVRLYSPGGVIFSQHNIDKAERKNNKIKLHALPCGSDGYTHQRGQRGGELVGIQ